MKSDPLDAVKVTMIRPGTTYQVLPDMPPEQYEALKADVAVRGVLTPVEIDEDGNILDGHHRFRAWTELGKNDPPPVIVRAGLNEDEKRLHARKANVLRRHLSREEIRRVIKEQLRDTPGRSDRFLAAALGVDHKTVGTVRKEGTATGEIPQLDKTTGTDGKKRSALPRARSGKSNSDSNVDAWIITAASAFGGNVVKRGDLPDDLKRLFFDAGLVPDRVILINASDEDPISEDDKRLWETFRSFLVSEGFDAEGADNHCGWLMRQGFTPASWLGPEGAQFRRRCGLGEPAPGRSEAWAAFATAQSSEPKMLKGSEQ